MSASKEWTEWHLTPEGWVSGSNRTDGPGVQREPDPAGSVDVWRFSETVSGIGASPHRWVSHQRRIGTEQDVAALTEKFGPCPERL
jgi:hypothetical protein